jgi:hypothetical protein
MGVTNMHKQPVKKPVSLTLDSRNRVCLTPFLSKEQEITSYRAYQKGDKIILEPMIELPAREVWLYQNPQALASVLEGLKQVEEGKTSELDIDYSEFLNDEEGV